VEGAGALRRLPASVLLLALIAPTSATAQEATEPAPQAASAPADTERAIKVFGKFAVGAGVGLAVHEASHVLGSTAFGAGSGVRAVRFGPIPFFAVTHREVSPAREFTIASAGFWAQHLGNEILLARRPHLRAEPAPFLKGVFAFNVLTSVSYAGAAFARGGPLERDTRSIAAYGRLREPVVGALILGPALLDTWRYVRPESAWAKWASRGMKVAGLVLVARATP